jgi:hypothetical protein
MSETVTSSERVSCGSCDFEMSKSFHGSAVAKDASEYTDILLPDECPVCGSEVASEAEMEATDE